MVPKTQPRHHQTTISDRNPGVPRHQVAAKRSLNLEAAEWRIPAERMKMKHPSYNGTRAKTTSATVESMQIYPLTPGLICVQSMRNTPWSLASATER